MQSDLTKNFFFLFGFPATYNIDVEQLTQRYRDLQSQLHPDKFAVATEQEKRLAMQLTAHINEGFSTLKDPLKRGRYLLEMKGIDTDDETDTAMPPEFLMEQMELREQLDEARQDSDPLTRLESLIGHVDRCWQSRIQNLRDCLQTGTDESNQQARMLIREMQFLQKLTHEIEEIEAGLA